MKFFHSRLSAFVRPTSRPRNIRLLLRFLVLLVSVVLVFSAVFHWAMYHEGRQFSWFTGIYWTLTVMSTLGFGDITFTSDLGRAFSTTDTRIDSYSILLLAGSEAQFARYDDLFCVDQRPGAPVVIIGGGRVGRATARALAERNVDYRIIEPQADRIHDPEKYIHGNAADLATLERSGVRQCPAIVITPHDDDLNSYLTIYCRRLRPDVQIISRAVLERNVSTLHRAGADFVLSYAAMGASAVFNLLERADVLMVAEGLHVLETEVPPSLAGKTLAEAAFPGGTGCNVAALRTKDGLRINPKGSESMDTGDQMILICTPDAEQRFLEKYRSRS